MEREEPVNTFLDRIRGIVGAREYVMAEFDIPEAMLEMACVITPGIESSTVSPFRARRVGWRSRPCQKAGG
jgi:ATP phosphoribosyltransferase